MHSLRASLVLSSRALTHAQLFQLLAHSQDLFILGNANECEYESESVRKLLGYSMLGCALRAQRRLNRAHALAHAFAHALAHAFAHALAHAFARRPVQFLTVHPDDRERHGAAHVVAFAATLETGAPVWTCQEMRLRTRDGRWIWFSNHFCHSGTRWLACLLDLSEAKRIETSLRDFLATTSHDARTPLSSIQVAAQLLRERLLNEEAADLLTAIIASARVCYTVDNVMLAKHLDAGSCLFGRAPVDLEALVKDVLATAQVGLASQAGTTVQLEQTDTPLPESVLSSEEHLSALLLNLTVYCVQAAAGSPVRIRVRIGPLQRLATAGAAHQLEFEVAVHGPGSALSAAELADLFDPLARDDPLAHWLHSGGGSGRLGLHVSRKLAQALGGDLKLLSDEQEGIRLCAALPVALSADAAPPEETPEDAATESHATPEQEPEEETGLLPFLPPDLKPSESFAELNRHGGVSSVVDLLLSNTSEAFLVAEQDELSYVSPGLHVLLRYAPAKKCLLLLLRWCMLTTGPMCYRHGRRRGRRAQAAATRQRRPRSLSAACAVMAAFSGLSSLDAFRPRTCMRRCAMSVTAKLWKNLCADFCCL